ncbi:hypothetical protein PANO111632_02820 [Paracoccus nototheniae]|uniref:Uncharacterized protein n=1 Tax=Paracoccus nototheniae TaxID=2489002 RepID=A0ABW4DY63_9RHOB|nr:hypothetical protein [Paracoccus nototheniae]
MAKRKPLHPLDPKGHLDPACLSLRAFTWLAVCSGLYFLPTLLVFAGRG